MPLRPRNQYQIVLPLNMDTKCWRSFCYLPFFFQTRIGIRSFPSVGCCVTPVPGPKGYTWFSNTMHALLLCRLARLTVTVRYHSSLWCLGGIQRKQNCMVFPIPAFPVPYPKWETKFPSFSCSVMPVSDTQGHRYHSSCLLRC